MRTTIIGFLLILASVFGSQSWADYQEITETSFNIIVLGVDDVEGSEIVIQKEQEFFETVAIAQRAVKLHGKTTATSMNGVAIFEAGDTLYGRYENRSWTYCGSKETDAARTAALGLLTFGSSMANINQDLTVCFHDSDDDGTFDKAFGGRRPVNESAMVVFDMVKIGLSDPVKYSRIPVTEGPKMPVHFKWSENENSGTRLEFVVGGKTIRQEFFLKPNEGDDPVSVTMSGAKILIKKYDAKADAIHLEIEKPLHTFFVRVPATRVITYY